MAHPVYPDDEVQLMKEYCSRKPEDAIFNGNTQKRVQYHFEISDLPEQVKPKFELLHSFLRAALPFNSPSDWVCIESKPGCLRQRQHADYNIDLVRTATEGGKQPAAFPYACKCLVWDMNFTLYFIAVFLHGTGLMSIEDGGSLFVCERGAEVRMSLDRGDTLVFRGDLVHAGADAPSGHFARVHCYLDSREVIHDRTTFYAGCNAPFLRVVRPRRTKSYESSNTQR